MLEFRCGHSTLQRRCDAATCRSFQAPALRPGTRLVREWNGRTHIVDVSEDGFVFDGKTYRLAVRHRQAHHRRTLVRTEVLRAMSTAPRLRCAIYTRKSTEEGLDQEFNSLDAQREACAAFIASQVGLGWKLVPDRYDDGGFSGGSMERPALQRLLQDIRDKKVDVVVVYKIDRLTRSLTDFARIVEVFDQAGVSFVSVTQQFNTTTSMGRLTLNVLLSFAQFEREVTAERIRDKIAASKKKGMWMGGVVPLGYRVENRKLVVNPEEAKTVRWLFERYLELKSVRALVDEAASHGHSGRTTMRRDGIDSHDPTLRPRQSLSPALQPDLCRQHPAQGQDL